MLVGVSYFVQNPKLKQIGILVKNNIAKSMFITITIDLSLITFWQICYTTQGCY